MREIKVRSWDSEAENSKRKVLTDLSERGFSVFEERGFLGCQLIVVRWNEAEPFFELLTIRIKTVSKRKNGFMIHPLTDFNFDILACVCEDMIAYVFVERSRTS